MKLSLEQFRERLVDYLYGMLDGDALREFEQCLAESEVCRRELAHMRSTLQTARQGLVKSNEQPPPRIRAALLAAAAQEAPLLAAAARERKSQRPSQRPSLRPSWRPRSSVPAAAPEAASFWSWLRAPWLLPTLGVAAAVAVVVLNKDVESPDLHRDEAAPTSREQTTPAPPAPSPAVQAPAPAAEPSREAEIAAPASESSAPAESRRARATAPGKGYAAPPAEWEELRSGREKKEQPARKAAAPKPASQDDLAGALGPDRDVLAAEATRGGAGAAVGTRHAAPAAAPAQPQAAADKASSEEAAADSGSEQDVLIKLARAHVKARRWALASETYRELLARFPSDTQVPVWRKQLATALAEQAHDAGR